MYTTTDLLIIGVTSAATAILGFVVYFNNRNSLTNKSLLAFSLLTAVWGFSNYFNYQVDSQTSHQLILWILRTHLFVSVIHSFSFFTFIYVFPENNKRFSKFYKFFIIPLVCLIALLTLSPLVFSGLVSGTSVLQVPEPIIGPGIALFGITAFGLIFSGIYILTRKTLKAGNQERRQFSTILLGAVITFLLILTSNFILPVFFSVRSFIPLGAIAVLPFIISTIYAVVRQNLFNTKVIATEGFSFLVVSVSFFQILTASTTADIIISGLIFIALLFVSVLLIRSVHKEVIQREQLALANIELGRLNEEKTAFLNFASHELRYAPTVIRNYTSMILEGTYGELGQKIKETVQTIFNLAQGDLKLVDDYLNVSRIEQGRMNYEFKKTNITKLVSDIVDNFQEIARQTNTKVTKTFDPQKEVVVTLDESKIKEVITNLVDNAVEKYAKGTSVEVAITEDMQNKKVLVKLSDTGLGMTQETVAKLFQRFSRAKSVEKSISGIKGSGLGLYLARQYVLAHGGRIWAESAGEGKGSVFFLELLSTPPENSVHAFEEAEKKEEEKTVPAV